MIVLTPIGFVRNDCLESQPPERIKSQISQIEILPEYVSGLLAIERQSYLDVVFLFHQERETELSVRIRSGEKVGVFASRSPRRPNHIGVTTVQLLEREQHVLHVKGLDALNHSPVIDIKCCDTSAFEQRQIHAAIHAIQPRTDVIRNIMENDLRTILFKAAMFHGHICPGLAMGVMAAVDVVQRILEQGEELCDYSLTMEMHRCPVDGILFVTGCSPGGNRLIFGDPEKNRFFFKKKSGEGWEVSFPASVSDYLIKQIPSQLPLEQKGWKTLCLKSERLFRVTKL